MHRQTELDLIDELLALKASKALFLDPTVTWNPIEHYTSSERFQAEQEKIFRVLPHAAAHVSELPAPGDFLRREIGGRPILITRDKSGAVNAFLNVCRHRGTRLVDDPSGCKHRFSCPYHAWTYANTGELIAAPHFDDGFQGADKSALGLIRLGCQERFGFIWVTPTPQSPDWLGRFFDGLSDELEALGIADMRIAAENTETRQANWKILVEGGIEAYHFKVAHRTTIGPYFEDNLSSYRSFGGHLRSVLPRTSMAGLTHAARETWRLRDHANILYTLFPASQLLVQQDHIVWISSQPLTPGETALRLVTLAPGTSSQPQDHWTKNHQITMTTLNEDFVIGESIQESTLSDANTHMIFGRFEGALDQFNRTVEHFLTA